MKKNEFLLSVRESLAGLPQDEIEERLLFYSEMIDDRMEEGLSEEEAIAAIRTADKPQFPQTSPAKPVPENKTKPKKRMNVWIAVLLAVGSPVWLSLLIAVIAVILSLYVVLWSVILSLWAVFVSLAACALAGILGGAAFAFGISPLTGAALIAAGLVCAGLTVFLFFGCRAASCGAWLLTVRSASGLKKGFFGKGETA